MYSALGWYDFTNPADPLPELTAALVDEMSLVLLKGSEIDFIDELAGAEFKVRNPNAKTSCGCGVSFSI